MSNILNEIRDYTLVIWQVVQDHPIPSILGLYLLLVLVLLLSIVQHQRRLIDHIHHVRHNQLRRAVHQSKDIMEDFVAGRSTRLGAEKKALELVAHLASQEEHVIQSKSKQ